VRIIQEVAGREMGRELSADMRRFKHVLAKLGQEFVRALLDQVENPSTWYNPGHSMLSLTSSIPQADGLDVTGVSRAWGVHSNPLFVHPSRHTHDSQP